GEQQLLPGIAAQRGIQIVHSMGSTAPLRGPFKRVTTIHDLNFRIVPESHFGVRGLGMRVLVPAAARRSHRIVVHAESTRDDLRQYLKVDPAKVDVIPLGVTLPNGVAPNPERMVLMVGAKRPHKNAAAVVEALTGTGLRLVVTGYRSPYDRVLRERADAL